MSVRTWEGGKEKTIAGSIDIEAVAQLIYDGIYPVNGPIIVSFAAPGIPKGVTATWVEDKTYSGRYLKLDGANASGTKETESLPIPTITLDKKGAHTHTRGTMNITGEASLGSGVGFGGGATGAFGKRQDDPNLPNYVQKMADANNSYLTFNAASNWTGETSSAGDHTHTVSISGGVYSAGAAVKPLTVTLKAWKRIS